MGDLWPVRFAQTLDFIHEALKELIKAVQGTISTVQGPGKVCISGTK